MARSSSQLRGVCQVCEADVAVKAANKHGHFTTSLHGYERPGNGWILGRCWGAQRPSWETSNAIVIQWRGMVADMIARTEQRLVDLRSRSIASISRREQKPGARSSTMVEYTPENPPVDRYSYMNRTAAQRWEELVAETIKAEERDLLQQKSELDRVTVRIAGWFFNPTGIRTIEAVAGPAPIAIGTRFRVNDAADYEVLGHREVRMGFRGRTQSGFKVRRLGGWP